MHDEPTTDGEPTRVARVHRALEGVGPFRFLRQIGGGGMGIVYLAEAVETTEHCATGDRVAIKVLRPGALAEDADVTRFQREVELGVQVRHPSVVRTLGAGEHEREGVTHHYLVLEYVAGKSLAELLREDGPFPEPLVRHVGARVARGLAAVHEHGFAHRDVKPANIILTPDQEVKLLDLGIARPLASATALTTAGVVVGTIRYCSPEQLTGKPIGPETDQYSLGMTLFEVTSGAPPFRGETLESLLHDHVHALPPRLSRMAPGTSRFLEAVVERFVAKAPTDRFESASEAADVLETGEGSAWWRERRHETAADAPNRIIRRLSGTSPPPLVGRDIELEALRERWRSASAGQGGLVVVEGEAGSGKSRLLAELVASAVRGGEELTVLHGEAAPGLAGHGVEALGAAILQHLGESRLEDALRSHLPLTPKLAPAFAALLTGADSGHEVLTPDALQGLFLQVARSLAARGPVLWLIDDVHAASTGLRDLLLRLGREAHERPLLFLATTRPGLPTSWTQAVRETPGGEVRVLGRLETDAIARLVREVIGSESIARRVAPRIAERSDGNPLFALELIGALHSADNFRAVADATDSTELDALLTVPSSVGELLRSRLDAVAAEDRELLDVAAVAGFSFDPGRLARALERKRLAVLQSLARLARSGGLVRASGSAFAFEHHLLQEVLTGALPESLRVEYHRRIAEVTLEQALEDLPDGAALPGEVEVELAEHFLRGHDARRGVPHALAAFEHLARRAQGSAVIGIAAIARQAPGFVEPGGPPEPEAEVTGDPDARWDGARWHVHLGQAHLLLNEAPLAEAHLRRALRLLVPSRGSIRPDAKAPIAREAIAQAAHLVLPNRLLRASAEEKPRLRLASRAAALLATHAWERGEVETLFLYSLLSANLAERAGTTSVLSLCQLGTAASALRLRPLARRYFERALRASDDPYRERDLVHAINFDVHDILSAGRLDGCRERLVENAERARRIAYRRGLAEAQGFLGVHDLSCGDFARADTHFADQLAELSGDALRTHESFALLGRAVSLAALGHLDQARELYLPARHVIHEHETIARSVLHGTGALIAARRGDTAEALREADAVLGLVRHGLGVPAACDAVLLGAAEAFVTAWRAAWRSGNDPEPDVVRGARRTLRFLRQWSRAHGLRVPRTLLVAGQIERLEGKDGAAATTWRRGLAAAERMGLAVDAALLRLELAAVAPAESEALRAAADAALEERPADGLRLSLLAEPPERPGRVAAAEAH